MPRRGEDSRGERRYRRVEEEGRGAEKGGERRVVEGRGEEREEEKRGEQRRGKERRGEGLHNSLDPGPAVCLQLVCLLSFVVSTMLLTAGESREGNTLQREIEMEGVREER